MIPTSQRVGTVDAPCPLVIQTYRRDRQASLGCYLRLCRGLGRRARIWQALMLCLLSVVAPYGSQAEPVTFRRVTDRVPGVDPMRSSSVSAARAVGLVYEGLLRYAYRERPYRLVPALAEAWPEISEDGRVYTFSLRKGVHFAPDPCFGTHADGTPRSRECIAEDVVYALKRLADAKNMSPGFWTVDGRILGLNAFRDASRADAPTDYERPVAGLRAVDPYTLRLELTAPAPEFLWVLAMSYSFAVPREAVERYGAALAHHSVGTGPYVLSGWQRNYQLTFDRNPLWTPHYREPAAATTATVRAPERVVYLVMDDPTTRWLSFLSGQLDLMSSISRDTWSEVVDAQGGLRPALASRGMALHSLPSLDTFYIGFNMDDPVVGRNRALRQALNCAFNAPEWQTLYQQRVVPAYGPVPPGIAGHLSDPGPNHFNLARARALLVEAGYPEGRDPRTGKRLVLHLALGKTDREVRESTELLIDFMKRVGVVIEPEYSNWPSFLRTVSRREAQMFRVGWLADYPDAENFLQLFYSRNVSPGPNRANYVNPEFDARYEAARATTDRAERERLVREMQEIVREDCPWLFLHHRRDFSLTQPWLYGFSMHDFPYGTESHYRLGAKPDRIRGRVVKPVGGRP